MEPSLSQSLLAAFGDTGQVAATAENPITPGPGDGKPKKKVWNPADEMDGFSKKILPYDKKDAQTLVRSAAQRTGVSPEMLYSSAFVEGMNKADQDLASDGWNEAVNSGKVDANQYPVDGYGNYGLDTFASKFPDLVKKGYLKADFAQQFHPYETMNDAKNPIKVQTASFRTNEDALVAKGAMLREGADAVKGYADKNKISLDEDALDYFTMLQYNGGPKVAQESLKEYMQSKDKTQFIKNGSTKYKSAHQNVTKRMNIRGKARQLLNPTPQTINATMGASNEYNPDGKTINATVSGNYEYTPKH